jgi:integrase
MNTAALPTPPQNLPQHSIPGNIVELPKANTEKNPLKASFDFEGKTYAISKRSATGPWTINVMINGERLHQSSKTTVKDGKDGAIEIFKALIRAAKSEKWDAIKQTKSKQATGEVFATMGEIFAAYDAGHNDGIKQETKDENLRTARGVIRKTLGLPAPEIVDGEMVDAVDGVASDKVLSAEFLFAWKKSVREGCQDEDELRQKQLKRTANTVLRKFRSLFSSDAKPLYKRAGLKLPPTLVEFMDEPNFPKVDKDEYFPPSDNILKATFKALPALEEKDANAYAAILLALSGGLRKGEIAMAKLDWPVQFSGKWFLSGRGVFKNSHGVGVAMLEPWGARLRKFVATLPKEQEFILAGSLNERTNECFRRVSAWMRELGWETDKAIHEFRAYAGSVVAATQSIDAACSFLRHSSVKVTEKHYLRYVEMMKLAQGQKG